MVCYLMVSFSLYLFVYYSIQTYILTHIYIYLELLLFNVYIYIYIYNISSRQPRIANGAYLSNQASDDSRLLSQSPLLKTNIVWQSCTTALGRSTKPFKSSRAAKPLAGCDGWHLPNQSKKQFKCLKAAMDRPLLVNSNLHF